MLFAGDHARPDPDCMKRAAPQIARLGLGVPFAVNSRVRLRMSSAKNSEWVSLRIASLNEGAKRAVQGVVLRAKYMAAAVPGEHRLAGGVVQHPAIAGVHAVLEQQIAGDVVAGNEAGTPGRRPGCPAPAA